MTETSDMWTGKASSYDRARPTPPPALLDLLTQVIQIPHPALVVDVGSGTGLSTALWAERAERVIGIEPNADMPTCGQRPPGGWSALDVERLLTWFMVELLTLRADCSLVT